MDLIEEILDTFLPALQAEEKEYSVRIEYLRNVYRNKLKDLFIKQDKISQEISGS